MAKPRPCAHCGVIFTPEFPRGAARMCSPECVTARRKVTGNAAAKRYYKRNMQARREKSRTYAREHRAQMNASWLDWANRNREHKNAKERERYAAKKAKPDATPNA